MSLDKLRSDYQAAEQAAQKLGNEYDTAKQKLKDRYTKRLRAANDKAAAAQKAFLDAEAATALKGREDSRGLAKALGLTDTAEALGIELLPEPEGE